MRTVFVFLFLALSLVSKSQAADEEFTARAIWEKSNPTCLSTIYFDGLEQRGVRYDALEKAIGKCRRAGYEICFQISNEIVDCNNGCGPTTCTASSTVTGIRKN